ncbi:MAG TPA: RNA-binding protein, partial [Candidatus Methanoperedenaceae archaeon]|nr:RNA-binding protein [Candidatus Methanoperedenaceae archaeon]
IDLGALCVESGKKVWMVFIDVHVLDDGGNLLDAAALGAIAALKTSKIPASRFELGEDTPLPVKDLPVAVTAVEIGGAIMLDPSLDEENVAGTRLTVISNQDGALSGMQKSGSVPLTTEQILHIVEAACEKAKEIRQKFLESLS